jgi:8-oxo-dGTP pyrophosphatase MutT (NUDIX family)
MRLARNTYNPQRYDCPNGHIYWNSPYAAVAVVLLQDNRLLVSKRAAEPSQGKYDLPGGFCSHHLENPFAAAVREVKEETTLVISEDDLDILGAYSGIYLDDESVCDIVILAKAWHGTIRAKDDSAELEWKPFTFLDPTEFAGHYPGISDKLRQITQNTL